MDKTTLFVGLDVHKKTIAVAQVEGSARANVRRMYEAKRIRRLGKFHNCYLAPRSQQKVDYLCRAVSLGRLQLTRT